jgi:hypothetical protein
MGRTKGSKNKPKVNNEELVIKEDNTLLPVLFGNVKDLKKEIRQLRKLKLQCRPGTTERLELEHKIKSLKKQRAEITIAEPGKDKLIAEILRIEAEQNIKPRFEDLGIDLHKFTEVELQKHIDIAKRKRGLDR